jgi:hypothetical protein
MRHNAETMLKICNIPLESMKFIWTSTECKYTRVNDEKGKPLLEKPLSYVWHEFPEYGPRNTIIIDDSYLKTRINPPQTVYRPESYNGPDYPDDALSSDGSFAHQIRSRMC